MSTCRCQSGDENEQRVKRRCPANGREYSQVSMRTVLHQLKQSWEWKASARQYYYCDDPQCDVAYFGDDKSVILKSELRTRIGDKERAAGDLLCYCFGVTRGEFLLNPGITDFIIAQTAAGMCSCETRNPSGRCCLKDLAR